MENQQFCASNGCFEISCNLRCPECRKVGIKATFCSQICFKNNYKSHKEVHDMYSNVNNMTIKDYHKYNYLKDLSSRRMDWLRECGYQLIDNVPIGCFSTVLLILYKISSPELSDLIYDAVYGTEFYIPFEHNINSLKKCIRKNFLPTVFTCALVCGHLQHFLLLLKICQKMVNGHIAYISHI